MKNTITYKDYVGSIEFSEDDKIFCGRVLGIGALVLYEGDTTESLIQDFHDSVDFYIESCKEKGIKPETPYKGSTNVRLKPETHKRAAIYATNHFMSLNNLIELSLETFLAGAEG